MVNKTPKKSHIQIKFLKAKVHIQNSSRWLACENRFPDGALPMIKFNNNAGFVQDPETMDSLMGKLDLNWPLPFPISLIQLQKVTC